MPHDSLPRLPGLIRVNDTLVQVCHTSSASIQREALKEQISAANTHPVPQGGILEQPSHGRGQRSGVARAKEGRVFSGVHDFPDRRNRARDDGQAESHGLDDRPGKPFES